MCFSPKVPKVKPDPNVSIQIQEQEQQVRDNKTLNKQIRLDDAMQLLSGRIGRASLFSGGTGGAGYASPVARSLFVRT